MKNFGVSDYGATPAFFDVEKRPPQSGEIQVEIRATALNFADLLMAKGRYQERPDPPVTLGMELAGEVSAVGDDVGGVAQGDRVAVYSGQGGLAEAGCFPAARAVKLPDKMPFDIAAGMLVAHGTSHLALKRRARLQPGERLLVLGAAGGVGLTAVQIGKRLGAEVIACARGAEKLAAAEAAGADRLIDSATEDIREAVLALGGCDVVYDPVGGTQFTDAFRATRPEGRILLIGFAGGDLPEIKPNHALVKNIALIGLNLGAYLTFAPGALADSFAELFAWYLAGEIDVHVSHRYTLDEAPQALEMLRSRQATGKIIVTP